MIQKERTKEIINLLNQRGVISIKTLCQELYCSKSTIRRDLIELEAEKIVRRTRGGVTLLKKASYEFSDNIRFNINKYEKSIIANIAKDFIENDMTIFLDSSSTVAALIPYLNKFNNLTIITNGIRTALNLNSMKNITTYVCCGKLKGNSTSLLGGDCINFLSQFNADISFISCKYCDNNYIYEADPSQAYPKKYMMHCSKKTILLADHTKFLNTALFKISDIKNIHTIITDKKLDNIMWNKILENTNIICK